MSDSDRSIDQLPELTDPTGADWLLAGRRGSTRAHKISIFDAILSGGMVPPGGLVGQVLMKLSNADYDVGWVSLVVDALGLDGGPPTAVYSLPNDFVDAGLFSTSLFTGFTDGGPP